MTLSINVGVRNPQTAKLTWCEVPPGYHLMGFETFRQELWGTEIMKKLGLELLPRLEGAYLMLKTPEEISQLEHEAELIRDNMDKILDALGPGIVYSLGNTYLRNIFYAVELARSVGGEIHI